MRVSEYIADRLSREADTVFMLAGGGAMFLNDSFSWHKDLKPVFCHHEQTCSMAAEAYARFSGKVGLVNVTTGPGGINALNGVFGAWTDSLPMIVVSGQVKRRTTLRNMGLLGKLRQLGDQEVDIISLAKSITKMATFISDVDEIPFVLEESINAAKSGRPGPVWIDVPIDIQSAQISPEKYFICNQSASNLSLKPALLKSVNETIRLIKNASRPIFLVGSGVRSAGVQKELLLISQKLNVPISTTWTAVDFIDHKSELYAERPGVVGTRSGNIILQKSDLVIVLGSRLPIRQVSYNWENFAKNAIKVGIDVDPFELSKPMVKFDLLINANLSDYVRCLAENIEGSNLKSNANKKWVRDINQIKAELPPMDLDISKKKEPLSGLNPYQFITSLWKYFDDDEIIAAADASASVIPLQIAPIKMNQRLFTNAGSASMGYELPAAIGAAFANPGRRIICLAGDGSIMLNVQELETIARYKLPIKIIILNNLGYLSIKLSQNGFFKREKGASINSGLGFPSFEGLAIANSMNYMQINALSQLKSIKKSLSSSLPALIEVLIDPEHGFQPKLGSHQKDDGTIESDTLENMTPYIDKNLLSKLMGD